MMNESRGTVSIAFDLDAMTTKTEDESCVYDLIIVGCGPAGIAAAIEFEKHSKKINYVLLEARNRVGGRVVTDRHYFGENAPIDLGAQWLHHYRPENPLYPYSKFDGNPPKSQDFVLRTRSTPIFDIDGSRISDEKIDRAEKITEQFCQQIQQAKLPVDQSMWDVIKMNYENINDDPQVKRILDLSLGIIEQYEASNLDELSAKSYLLSDGGVDMFNVTIPTGFGTLIERIVDQHHLPVKLNSIVTRIDASAAENDGLVRIETDDHRVFQCKFVLVTIPLGCLKKNSVDFVPPLPDWKRQAIDRMGVGQSNKIFLQFPSVFWDPEWPVFWSTSPKYRFILCQPQAALLLVKLAARVSLESEEKTDEEIIDEVMNLLRTIFSDRHVPSPIRSLITRWNQDRFACGAYSNFAIGCDNQTLIDLARECHQRIFWAGEHANYNGTIGCVDSAFESGQREAKRLLERLDQ